jgi:hypothetical protein
MKLLFRLLTIVACCQVSEAQIIREYDVEKQAEHATVKGYDPNYRVNYFENIILRTSFTSDVPRIEVANGILDKTFDIRPAAAYQIGYSVDYKWFAVGIVLHPVFF